MGSNYDEFKGVRTSNELVYVYGDVLSNFVAGSRSLMESIDEKTPVSFIMRDGFINVNDTRYIKLIGKRNIEGYNSVNELIDALVSNKVSLDDDSVFLKDITACLFVDGIGKITYARSDISAILPFFIPGSAIYIEGYGADKTEAFTNKDILGVFFS